MEGLLGWDVIGWIIGFLLPIGVGVLALNEFRLAKCCFVISAAILLIKAFSWGVTTDQPVEMRAIIIILSFGIVGVVLVESFRWIDRKQTVPPLALTPLPADKPSPAPMKESDHGVDTVARPDAKVVLPKSAALDKSFLSSLSDRTGSISSELKICLAGGVKDNLSPGDAAEICSRAFGVSIADIRNELRNKGIVLEPLQTAVTYLERIATLEELQYVVDVLESLSQEAGKRSQ